MRKQNMGRINLNPTEHVLEARDLNLLIQKWVEECYVRLKKETAAGYEAKICYFCRWWERAGPAREWKLSRSDLQSFERSLRKTVTQYGKPLSYHSRNDILRRLSAMFRWAFREGYTDKDYSVWIPEPDGEPPTRRAARLDELEKLFAAASQSPKPARDRAILAVLIGTGIRRGECASLRAENVEFHADGSGTAIVQGKRTRSNRSGRRQVAFDRTTGYYLAVYMDAAAITTGPLWRGPNGALSVRSIGRVVKRALVAAGLDKHFKGPHDLRRTFATTMARHAKDLQIDGDKLRRQMGHSSYRMTSQYSLLDVEDIRDTLESPMALIKRNPGAKK